MPAQRVARIKRARIPKDTVTMARGLLGKVLVRKLTPRNRSLFLDRGHAYVYQCYGTSYMLISRARLKVSVPACSTVPRRSRSCGACSIQKRTRALDGFPCSPTGGSKWQTKLHPSASFLGSSANHAGSMVSVIAGKPWLTCSGEGRRRSIALQVQMVARAKPAADCYRASGGSGAHRAAGGGGGGQAAGAPGGGDAGGAVRGDGWDWR
jgi:hypothetical protein